MNTIKTTQLVSITTEIDPNTFTFQQWKDFIIQNLSPTEIKRTIDTDLFPFDRLKERALIAHNCINELLEI